MNIKEIIIAILIVLILASAVIYFANIDEPLRKNDNIDSVGKANETPGHEPVFAIVVLLSVSYIILRRRE